MYRYAPGSPPDSANCHRCWEKNPKRKTDLIWQATAINVDFRVNQTNLSLLRDLERLQKDNGHKDIAGGGGTVAQDKRGERDWRKGWGLE